MASLLFETSVYIAWGIAAILRNLSVNLTHTQGGDHTIIEEYGSAFKEEGAEALLEGVNEEE